MCIDYIWVNFISTIAKMGITNNNTEMVAEMVDATISLR